jgi:radical SAM protein with 4Fe4S-binding SPASM domain
MKHPYPKSFSSTPDGMPTVFYVETVLSCNLKCPECVIGSDNVDRTKRVMKMAEFSNISAKIEKYAKLVYLHKWGEPTMNKNIYDMVAMVSQYAHSHIMTNGLLLDKEKIQTLILNGLGTLIFSIDGMTQTVYEKYRVGGDVSLALKNLLLASEINSNLGNPTDLIAQFIVFKHNEHELDSFISFCNAHGIRYHIRSAYIRYGAVEIPNAKKYRRTVFETKSEHLKAISSCPHGDYMMTITADGRLLLCSQDYNAEYGLGNILDDSVTLESLWLNPKYQQLRDLIKNQQPPDICKKNCMIYPASVIY